MWSYRLVAPYTFERTELPEPLPDSLVDGQVLLRFLAEAKRGLREIVAHPERWPAHLHDTRRFRFRRFPYSLIYRIREDALRLLAVPHDHQAPGYWRRRK